MNTSTLVQKLWNCCNVLRDDGMSYGDYPRLLGDRLPQLTSLLFLKMADERSRPPYNQACPVPAAYAWPELLTKDGDDLFDHCRHTLEELGKQPGTLAPIFGKAQNKFQDPAKLRRVIVTVFPSLFRRYPRDARGPDEHDAYATARWMREMSVRGVLDEYFAPPLTLPERATAALEGWILGVR